MKFNNNIDMDNWEWDSNELLKIDNNNKDLIDSLSCAICISFKLNIMKCELCKFLISCTCLTDHQRKGQNKSCPQCRKYSNYKKLEYHAKKMLNQVKIFCLNKEKGCKNNIKNRRSWSTSKE